MLKKAYSECFSSLLVWNYSDLQWKPRSLDCVPSKEAFFQQAGRLEKYWTEPQVPPNGGVVNVEVQSFSWHVFLQPHPTKATQQQKRALNAFIWAFSSLPFLKYFVQRSSLFNPKFLERVAKF